MPYANRTCFCFVFGRYLLLTRRHRVGLAIVICAGLLNVCVSAISHGQHPPADRRTSSFGSFQPVSSPLRPFLQTPTIAGQKDIGRETGQLPPSGSVKKTVLSQEPLNLSVAMDEIAQRMAALENLTQRDPAPSGEVKNLVDAAKLLLEQGRDALETARSYGQQARSAPEEVEALQAQLAGDHFEAQLPFNEQTPFAQLPRLTELEAELAPRKEALQKTLEPIEILTSAQQKQRIADIKARTAETMTKLEELKDQLQADPLSDDQAFVQARRWKLESERLKLMATLQSNNAEIRFHRAAARLPELQKAIAEKLSVKLDGEISLIENAIGRIRSSEIQNLKRQSRNTQERVSEPLQPIAKSNTELTQQLAVVAAEIEALDETKDAITKDVTRIKREETTTRTRINVVGLSDSFGQMLQRNRTGLAETQQRYLSVNQRSKQIANSQITSFRWEDELARLSSIPDAASATVDLLVKKDQATAKLLQMALEKTVGGKDKLIAGLESEARDLFSMRKDILNRLKGLEDQKGQELLNIQAQQKELTKACESYTALIDENILWVRSAPIAGFADGSVIAGVVRDIASPANWITVWNAIVASFRHRLLASMLVTLVVVALFLFRANVLESISAAGRKAIKRSCRDYGVTLMTYMLTLGLAFTALSPLALTGWLLSNNLESSTFAASLGQACFWTFLIGLPFEFLRQACRQDGLAHSHFAWTERTRKVFWNNLTWFVPMGVPIIALLIWLPLVSTGYRATVESDTNATATQLLASTAAFDFSGIETREDDLASGQSRAFEFSHSSDWNRVGRVVLLGLLLVSQIFAWRTMHPKRGVLIDSSSTALSHAAWTRIGYVVFVGVIIIPLVLMLMATVGYYFSAIQIGRSLLKTIILAVVVAMIYSGAMRFLLVRRRHLRYEQLVHQRNQARLAAEKKGNAEGGASPAEVIDIDLQNDPGLDITDVSRQARELTSVIFLMISAVILLGIWQYLLPASKIMDDWKLWSISLEGKIVAVTIRDVLFSAMMFLVTYFGVRNIPGMLELILLQRLPLDAGARYAVTSIFRYVLLVVGCIFALGYLKIPWSNYSWLIAAISVGLGFGLQEIVANFVSGLILLLERPVRVGDVVTIDGTTGVVSRIQMRATTVTNWDNQELVVPNKDLISGKLLNWTLSSVVNRIALRFGVAYGTDPVRVQKIILDAVSSNRALLKEPAPVVTFEKFGDSSLDFTLRCCISTIERRWIIIHELNVAINQALESANISIPFPQREVRLISSETQPPSGQTGV